MNGNQLFTYAMFSYYFITFFSKKMNEGVKLNAEI